jgi:MFS transporter, CP family, cyanate transporter
MAWRAAERPDVSRTRKRGLGTGLLVAGILALAFNMRAAISSLPPVFPELSGALRISVGAEAVLAAIPVLCFGVFSGIAAPLSRRIGEERVLGAALVLLAGGLLLRGALPGALLFPGTVIASCAIALMNVLMPSLIKRRHPDHAGLLIGLYLLSLAIGAIAGALIAVPVFAAAAGAGGVAGSGGAAVAGGAAVGASAAVAGGAAAGAVRLTLGLWALPALVAAAVWLPQLRFRTLPWPAAQGDAASGQGDAAGGQGDAAGGQGDAASGQDDAASGGQDDAASGQDDAASGQDDAASGGGRPRGVLSMGRSALVWQVTAFMGLQSLTYYAALSWFPTLFRSRGVSAVHAGDLLALMSLGNAFTALLLPVLAHRARDQRMLVAVSVLITAAGMAGAALGPLAAAAPLMFVLGLGQGATLGLSIFLFTARSPDPATSASLSGFAQAGGYLLASTGPLLIGVLHAVTGGWTVPVWLLLGFTALQLVVGWLAGRDLTLPVPGGAAARASAS